MRITTLIATSALVTLTACQQQAASPAPAATSAALSEADATKIFQDSIATWQSMDGAKVKALYAPSVVGFDPLSGPLVTDRAAWDKNQDAFVAGKYDKFDTKASKLQVLDPDTFIANAVWDVSSSAKPSGNMTIRCTEVYHKDADGKWLIVNEHCSMMPKATA